MREGHGIGWCAVTNRPRHGASSTRPTPNASAIVPRSSKVDGAVTCEAYNSIPEMQDSDHKPVYGVYRVQLDYSPDFVLEDEAVTNPSASSGRGGKWSPHVHGLALMRPAQPFFPCRRPIRL